MNFKSFSQFSIKAQDIIRRLQSYNEKEHIKNLRKTEKINSNYDGLIIVNYDNFVPTPHSKKTDEPHGIQMLNLQKEYRKKYNINRKFVNIETEYGYLSNSMSSLFKGIDIKFSDTKSFFYKSSPKFESKRILDIENLCSLISEDFPKSKVILNLSLQSSYFPKNEATKLFNLANKGVKVNVSGGNNDVQSYNNNVYELIKRIIEEHKIEVKDLDYKDYLEIDHLRKKFSPEKNIEGQYNFGGSFFNEEDIEKKLDFFEEGKFNEKELFSLKESVVKTYFEEVSKRDEKFVFDVNGKKVKRNTQEMIHQIPIILIDYYNSLPPNHQKDKIKENLSIIEAIDYSKDGIFFNVFNNKLNELSTTNNSSFNKCMDFYNKYISIQNDPEIPIDEKKDFLLKMTTFFNENGVGNGVFYSTLNNPNRYSNNDLIKTVPIERFNEYTSEACAIYSISNEYFKKFLKEKGVEVTSSLTL